MELTPEQKKILINGLRQHDFTAAVPLPEPDVDGRVSPRIYTPLEKRVLGYMRNNLPALGITRQMENFFSNYPVNLLMDADAKYIACEGMNILNNEERTTSAVEQYFELFVSLIEKAAGSYCKAKQKNVQGLL